MVLDRTDKGLSVILAHPYLKIYRVPQVGRRGVVPSLPCLSFQTHMHLEVIKAMNIYLWHQFGMEYVNKNSLNSWIY